jgi:hypothetical protein
LQLRQYLLNLVFKNSIYILTSKSASFALRFWGQAAAVLAKLKFFD